MIRPELDRTERDVAEASARLRAEYDSLVHGREDDPEAFLEQLNARLEELATNGAAAGPGAAAIRRFLAELDADAPA